MSPDDLTDAFVAELDAILGPRLAGLIRYGAECFPPSPVSDYDAHVFVTDPFDDAARDAIRAMRERLHALPGGDDMDVWFVTLDEARSRDLPQTQMNLGQRDGDWALHRAHWHAGRFVLVRGTDPRTIVPEPTWEEIDVSLVSNLESLRKHVSDSPAYVTLNTCRILYSYETRDVVTGKFQAGLWAMAALDVGEHAIIREAMEAYRTGSYAVEADAAGFYDRMCARIARARELV